MEKLDLTGKRFGRLTVLREDVGHRQKSGKLVRRWICQCSCGNIVSVGQRNLTRKEYRTISCGCYAREDRKERLKCIATTHGHRKDRLYSVWCGMRNRCANESVPEYHVYGGRGIEVCSEWKNDYAAFRTWALDNGYDPTAKRGQCTIDRIDNDGNYCPENCKISTMKEQAQNKQNTRRYLWNDEYYTLSEIMAQSGTHLTRICLYKRLNRGMSVADALSIPLQSNQYGVRKNDKQRSAV